jgi:hypothetical protein
LATLPMRAMFAGGVGFLPFVAAAFASAMFIPLRVDGVFRDRRAFPDMSNGEHRKDLEVGCQKLFHKSSE